MARRPEAVAGTDQRLRVVAGDVLTPSSLREGIVAADAMLSALGSRAIRQPTTVYSQGTAAILAAMHDTGVRRFIGVTAAPVAPQAHKSPLERRIVHPLLQLFLGGQYDDMRRMEKLLAASDADWTVFRPPRLTNCGDRALPHRSRRPTAAQPDRVAR